MTGGAGDIGRAATKLLLNEGGVVVSADIFEEGKARQQIGKDIGADLAAKVNYFEGDVVNPESVANMVEFAKKQSPDGHIHCFFNNAGILGQFAPTPDITEQ